MQHRDGDLAGRRHSKSVAPHRRPRAETGGAAQRPATTPPTGLIPHWIRDSGGMVGGAAQHAARAHQVPRPRPRRLATKGCGRDANILRRREAAESQPRVSREIVRRSFGDRSKIVRRSLGDRRDIAVTPLPPPSLAAESRKHSSLLLPVSRARNLGYISPISRLSPGYLSVVSRLSLGCLSPISRLSRLCLGYVCGQERSSPL